MTEINLKRQLLPYEWLQFPMEIRDLFKKTFGILRTGGSIVVGDKLLSDGHTNEDLEVVNLKRLQEYNQTDETHWDKLLQLTINKMEAPEDGNAEIVTDKIGGTVANIEQGTTGKRRGRTKAQETT